MISEKLKNDWINNINAEHCNLEYKALKTNDGYDPIGVLLDILVKNKIKINNVTFRWKVEDKSYTIEYQLKKDYSFLYGGKYLPTKALIDILGLDDDFVTELCFCLDKTEVINKIKGLNVE